MGAFWNLFICVLTVWLTKGSCLPVGGSTESSDNGLQRRMRDLPPNDFSIKKALTLHHSHKSMSLREYKKVELETKEVDVNVSAVLLKVVVESKSSGNLSLADGAKGNLSLADGAKELPEHTDIVQQVALQH
ncbi:polysialoglycoprotein-like [Cebidichthys violaceus]|uniref:polysialoglycoprotein-like n=1 Tax=Cebidichthys violaceus TaxID=271503 RepID=UPI0035CBF107